MVEENKSVAVNPFEPCGIMELAPSGKSIRIITVPEGTVFEQVIYIGREAATQVLHGHKKQATVYRLKEKEE